MTWMDHIWKKAAYDKTKENMKYTKTTDEDFIYSASFSSRLIQLHIFLFWNTSHFTK